MRRKRLTFLKGTDLHTEMTILASLGFTAVRSGDIIEVSDFQKSDVMKISPQEFFHNLAKRGVVVREI